MSVPSLSPHWTHVLTSLTELLDKLKSNKVPAFLIRELIQQVFSFVNAQLFNQLITRRECRSFANGVYVRTGLAELEAWLHDAGDAHVGRSWDELRHIRQAVEFLVIHQKPNLTLAKITNDLCPVLSIHQLYRISTMYWDDRYGTETVSHEVLRLMKQLMMQDTHRHVSNRFLLDDDASIPFTVEAISTAMSAVDIPSLLHDIVLPPPLMRHPAFASLHTPIHSVPTEAPVTEPPAVERRPAHRPFAQVPPGTAAENVPTGHMAVNANDPQEYRIPKDYEKMILKELKAVARYRRIARSSTMTRPELLERLT